MLNPASTAMIEAESGLTEQFSERLDRAFRRNTSPYVVQRARGRDRGTQGTERRMQLPGDDVARHR